METLLAIAGEEKEACQTWHLKTIMVIYKFNVMGVICRLLFVILFIPGCFIGMAFDLVMYIAIGDKHEPYKVLDWLGDNLADYGKNKG